MSKLPECETLIFETTNGRLDLIFNRPDQRNAVNSQMAAEFARTVEWLSTNEDIRIVVLRGAGGNFCAGGDIKERVAMAAIPTEYDTDPILCDNMAAGQAFLAFENLPQTTIAAIEGAAFGGGMGYACLADITIVAKSAILGMPETTLGVAPAQIASFVVQRIGLSRARQLALSAEIFNGEKAYEYGIAHYLCEDGGLEELVNKVVAKVLKCAPKANAATKQIMLNATTLTKQEMVTYAAKIFATLNRGGEAQEGQSAFVQRRQPDWQLGKDKIINDGNENS